MPSKALWSPLMVHEFIFRAMQEYCIVCHNFHEPLRYQDMAEFVYDSLNGRGLINHMPQREGTYAD
jgi:hypothetical protein